MWKDEKYPEGVSRNFCTEFTNTKFSNRISKNIKLQQRVYIMKEIQLE